MTAPTHSELDNNIREALEDLVGVVMPDEDGQSLYDSLKEQNEAAEEAIASATQSILKTILSALPEPKVGNHEYSTPDGNKGMAYKPWDEGFNSALTTIKNLLGEQS